METGLTTAIVLAAALGYACGSIPFGLLLTRIAGMGDVRKIGSGNIGATNVLRTGNKGLAAATLLLDLAKGFVPVMLAGRLFAMPGAMPEAAIGPVPVAALFAVLGHCFPVWLGFRGGKGWRPMPGSASASPGRSGLPMRSSGSAFSA